MVNYTPEEQPVFEKIPKKRKNPRNLKIDESIKRRQAKVKKHKQWEEVCK